MPYEPRPSTELGLDGFRLDLDLSSSKGSPWRPGGCYRKTAKKLTRLNAHMAAVRQHAIHNLTQELAKTHGVIVVEGLDATGMLRQKGLPGARARRRGLSDAALGEPRRQLRYKCAWYGSTLVEADRILSLLQDVPCLWPRPRHWLVGALELRGLQGRAPARRQRRHQPRQSGEPGRSWRSGEAWSRAQDRASPGSWRRHAKARLAIGRAEQLREECSVSGLTNAHSAATGVLTVTAPARPA